MDSINNLIAYLTAIQNFAKDIHYSAKGEAFYSKHLLADRINDDIEDFIDSIKEIFFLGNETLPLLSSEYLKKAISYIPQLTENDSVNFVSMKNLLSECLVLIQEMKTEGEYTEGELTLLGDIAKDLQGKLGLINRQAI